MYGDVLQTPQTERTPFNPQSPYACAKVYAFHQTINYRRSYDLFAVTGFYSIMNQSPGRNIRYSENHSCSRAYQGRSTGKTLGNLDAKRDWGYAKDYVKGMHLIHAASSAR